MKVILTFEDKADGTVKVISQPPLAPIMKKIRDVAKAAQIGVQLDTRISPAEGMAGQCALVILSSSNATNKRKLIVEN